MKLTAIISTILNMIRLMVNLAVLWLSFGWKVRKARKAFEKELIKMGMAKNDAKRLSALYSKLRDDIVNTVKSSIFAWR
ncbi:hypothetical protein KEJ45_06510 [Candidatus Bathyarchaeota archaeon]|nr:hypothetical protein [Candidatus Bathyarchaeota archaeon]